MFTEGSAFDEDSDQARTDDFEALEHKMTTIDRASFWTPEGLRKAAGGRWLFRPVDEEPAKREIAGVSIDSRTIKHGEAFLAIPGEHADGHEFVADALANGAAIALVSRTDAIEGLDSSRLASKYVLQVDDTTKALARLAITYRRTLTNVKVIAITGSSGKTTTKEFIHAILSTTLRGSANVKSYNNHLGVPLTILAARPTDHYLINEIGTNAPGEIRALASIVEPEIAVITNIGRAHLEGLGSLEGVAAEKGSLLAALSDKDDGWAIIPAEGADVSVYARPGVNIIRFGESDAADPRLTDYTMDHETSGATFEINNRSRWRLPIAGKHNALNALAAIAVARRMGMPDERIAEGLRRLRLPSMRFEETEIAGVRIFNDAYNANPESTRASIACFLESTARTSPTAGRRVLVLGDMLELGGAAAACHEEVLIELAARAPGERPDRLILFGPAYGRAAAKRAGVLAGLDVATHDEADAPTLQSVAQSLRPGDAVLVKGSRRIGLERLLETLQAANADERKSDAGVRA